MSQAMIVFEDWKRVLKATVPGELQGAYQVAVTKFRYWLWEHRRLPTAEAFKEHLAWKQSYLPPDQFAIRRQALRWYWERGVKRRIQESGFRSQKGERPDIRRVGAPAKSCSGIVNGRRGVWAGPDSPTAQGRGGLGGMGQKIEMTDVPTKGAAVDAVCGEFRRQRSDVRSGRKGRI
jgi:hypothetical protein